MSDHHDTSVPPGPAPAAPPSTPLPQRSGCVTAILIVIGIVLLLPGLCVMLLVNLTSGHYGREEIQLLFGCGIVALGGIVLIVWAIRRP